MPIETAKDARDLVRQTTLSVITDAVQGILPKVEEAARKGKSSIVYSLDGKEHFKDEIIKELETREFKVKYNSASGDFRESYSASLTISW